MSEPFSATSLSESLYVADAVRKIDRFLIDDCGYSGFELMTRAASAAFRRMRKCWTEPGLITVFCGSGNNAGDGYLMAASCARHNVPVCCVAAREPSELSGDAARARDQARSDGVEIVLWSELSADDKARVFSEAGLIVDAMLGTGVDGPLRAPFDDLVGRCNGSDLPILALDVPSGLNASDGSVASDAVRATCTVTFIADKVGLYTGQGAEYSGDVIYDDLGVSSDSARAGEQPAAQAYRWPRAAVLIPQRRRTAHKGSFGTVLVVAGDRGFGGAGLMVSEAVSRAGAGRVTLATRPEHTMPMLARFPSVMVRGVEHGIDLQELLEAADVVVCGPGIGQKAWGQQMLQQVIASGKPRVLDADALNLMASKQADPFSEQVLTPHPGEAARLLGCSVADIENDRLGAAAEISRRYGGICLLKGAGTVLACGSETRIIIGANPGMATGGMGDVLAGLVGSLVGQKLSFLEAATLAAALHLEAARLASEKLGFMGLLPTDVVEFVPAVLAPVEQAYGRHHAVQES